jgi:hypothetical protein
VEEDETVDCAKRGEVFDVVYMLVLKLNEQTVGLQMVVRYAMGMAHASKATLGQVGYKHLASFSA